jgi:hypothetical protein
MNAVEETTMYVLDKKSSQSAGIPRRLKWARVLGLALVLGAALPAAGCTSVMDVKGEAQLNPGARWVLLPFSDFGETPQAAERAEELSTAMMRVKWNVDLERYPVTKESVALVDLDERQRYDKALQWARDQGYSYGLAGSVQEWRYRAGSEGEAAVGLSLRVINIQNGKPEWIAAGSRSGFGAQTVSGVAEKLLRELVGKIRMK